MLEEISDFRYWVRTTQCDFRTPKCCGVIPKCRDAFKD